MVFDYTLLYDKTMLHRIAEMTGRTTKMGAEKRIK